MEGLRNGGCSPNSSVRGRAGSRRDDGAGQPLRRTGRTVATPGSRGPEVGSLWWRSQAVSDHRYQLQGVPVGNSHAGAHRPGAGAKAASRQRGDRVGAHGDVRRGGAADGHGGGEVGPRDPGDGGPQHPVLGGGRVSRRRGNAGNFCAVSDPGPGAAVADQEADGGGGAGVHPTLPRGVMHADRGDDDGRAAGGGGDEPSERALPEPADGRGG